MTHYLIEKNYIPLDKSWIIRMGILDLLYGYNDTIRFLERQKQLSNDLKALYQALIVWKYKKPIDVGESGTLYRFLKFVNWKLGLNKKFILRGSLLKRKICDNSKIINYSLEKLLKIDNGTSQWASASVLLGNKEKIINQPFKLKLTYEAVRHWKWQRKKNKCWEPRYDETILRQAIAFLKLIKKRKVSFVIKQSEDYCFARAFGFISKVEGESRWPSLRGHESDRIEEMEKMLKCINEKKEINSKDHRVVQAIAMYQKKKNIDIKVKYPNVVNKSWPQFWQFLNDIPYLK